MQKLDTPIADIIRTEFLEFYKAKGHKEIPNVSLVPNLDSTLLFTNSGMFPLVNYLGGLAHPLGKRLVNIQRCLRTNEDDLAEIGDWKHSSMFEMLGNWSLGDYFKKEQIGWVTELYIEKFGLDINKIYVTVFTGDNDAPRDIEAIENWEKAFSKYGIQAEVADVHFMNLNGKDVAYRLSKTGEKEIVEDWKMEDHPNVKIFLYDKKKNWWQRGHAEGELGGPDSEIFYDTGHKHDYKIWGAAHPNSDSPKFLEIGNSVFMQYKLDKDLNWQELTQKNVDFGGGFSRILLCRQNVQDLFETEIFIPLIKKIAELTHLNYKDGKDDNADTKYFRIIADHIFAATFIIADGINPGNKEQGYILRRLIRRSIRMGKRLGLENNFLAELAEIVVAIYCRHYPHLETNWKNIQLQLNLEEDKFRKTLTQGLKEFTKYLQDRNNKFDGKQLFYLYETYGFPLELSLEELAVNETEAKILTVEYKEAEIVHRSNSRVGAEKKFTGGLADQSEATTILHTTHHILLKVLQEVLGEHVHQRGSNITAERLRLDFTHDAKLSPEQILKVEYLVNEVIARKYVVLKLELPKEIAATIGAEMEFGQKYGEMVNVYLIGDLPLTIKDIDPKELSAKLNGYDIYSKEFCGGPHVNNTNEISAAGRFKIFKEESSGSGVRRIKAGLVK